MITVIGLGTKRGDVTARAIAAMKKAQKVLVRNMSPAAQTLHDEGIPFETLDFVFEKSRNFDTLAKNLAAEVKKRAEGCDLCYCVEGGVFEDRAASLLKGAAVIEGVSKSASAAALAGLAGGYQAVSAYDLADKKLTLPLVVYDLDNELLAGDVKLLLCEKFGDEAPACYIEEGAKKLPLFEIDRQSVYSPRTALVVYDLPLLQKKRFDFEDFLAILRRLRAPDGCPWDRVQTHESIRINAIEEAYELVDAIDLHDPDKMCEEAGDVLMQSLFHTLIEEEQGNFTVTDMLSGVCEKLITRHTHVFGADKAKSAEGALSVWDKNKMAEKHQTTYSDAVNDVPACFPALLRAQKIAKRVEKGGWDAATFENFERKFKEEYGELKEAVRSGDKKATQEELGDVLFCAVELGRAVGEDCEMALLDTVKKMQKRYTCYENLVRADGKDPTLLGQEEKEMYYRRAKNEHS